MKKLRINVILGLILCISLLINGYQWININKIDHSDIRNEITELQAELVEVQQSLSEKRAELESIKSNE